MSTQECFRMFQTGNIPFRQYGKGITDIFFADSVAIKVLMSQDNTYSCFKIVFNIMQKQNKKRKRQTNKQTDRQTYLPTKKRTTDRRQTDIQTGRLFTITYTFGLRGTFSAQTY